MKKLLCILGILILFGLAILPPVLRVLLPDQISENKEKEIERVNLTCSNTSYITSTSYDGEEIKMIILKHLNNEYSEDIIEEETKKELIDLFEDLKTKGAVLYKEVSDGEVISIDFSVSDNKKLNLINLTQDIENQKKYYESQNLECMIKR